MKVLGRIFLNSRKDVKTERRKDVKMDRRKDGVFLWVVEELTFLIRFYTYIYYYVINIKSFFKDIKYYFSHFYGF